MGQLLYCKRADCQAAFQASGVVPRICPVCERETSWSTAPTTSWPFPLTQDDQVFLRVNKIAQR